MNISKLSIAFLFVFFIQTTHAMQRSKKMHNLAMFSETVATKQSCSALKIALAESRPQECNLSALTDIIINSRGHEAIKEGNVAAFTRFVQEYYDVIDYVYDLQGNSIMAIWRSEWEKTKKKIHEKDPLYLANGKQLKLTQILSLIFKAQDIREKRKITKAEREYEKKLS